LIGLASFLGPFCFGTFWRFYSKGGECGTKASLWLKLTSGLKDTNKWFKGYETKGENVNMKIKKREVSSRGSLDDGKHPSKCKWF
jgi:hypothetical protein